MRVLYVTVWGLCGRYYRLLSSLYFVVSVTVRNIFAFVVGFLFFSFVCRCFSSCGMRLLNPQFPVLFL